MKKKAKSKQPLVWSANKQIR